MLELAKAVVSVRADMQGLHQDLATGKAEIKESLEGLAQGFEGIAGMIGIGFGIGELISQAKESVAVATDFINTNTRLETVLRATGEAAGFNKEQLEGMAEELDKSGLASKEDIKQAEIALLRHKELTGEMFKQAVAASADLAAMQGGSAAGSAQMLGRALENPMRGMMMLRRMHVDISEQQREQIKNLTKQNNLQGAQAIILKAVQSSTGGANAAMANNPAGQIKKVNDATEEMRAKIGEALMPAALAWAKVQQAIVQATGEVLVPLSHVVTVFEQINTATGGALLKFAMAGAGVTALGLAMAATWPMLVRFVAGMRGVIAAAYEMAVAFATNPFVLITAGVAAAVYAFVEFTDAGRAMWAAVVQFVGPIADIFQDAFAGIKDAISSGDLALAAAIAIAGLKTAVLQGLASLADAIGGDAGDFMGAIVGRLASGDLLGAWQALISGMYAMWADFSSGVVGVFTSAAKAIVEAWVWLETKIESIILGLINNSQDMRNVLGIQETVEETQARDKNIATLRSNLQSSRRMSIEQLQPDDIARIRGGMTDEQWAAYMGEKPGEVNLGDQPDNVGKIGDEFKRTGDKFNAGLDAFSLSAKATAAQAQAALHKEVGGGAGRAEIHAALDASKADLAVLNAAAFREANPELGMGGVQMFGFNFPGMRGGRGGGSIDGQKILSEMGAGSLGGFKDVATKIQDAMLKGKGDTQEALLKEAKDQNNVLGNINKGIANFKPGLG